nr:ribonuclease H-like domain-containing protein [Tanacetum cinerariifolium]
YLQHEYYALWEVIEFGNSYKAPPEETAKDKGLAGEVSSSTKKKGRTMAITAEDMQKRKNDVKARTTLFLALFNEHQLRFSKYDSAKELWESILKTFGGNEATKKTKKNQLKQQYGNFKAEGSETLKQTFNRLQAIVSHLEFMDVSIEQDDLNQKFLISLASEWLVYTIVWRNRDDIDTMSLDDMYTNLKVYEPEVQKRARADRFWKKTSKKITIQGSNVAGFKKSKVECFSCYKMGHFAREYRSPRSQDRGKRESYKKDPKVEEPAPMAMIAIDGIRWDWSYMAEEDEASKNHALVADEEEVLIEYALMDKSSSSSDNEVYDDSFCSKSCKNNTKNLNTKIGKLNEELSDFLKRDIELKDNKIEYLKNELEEVKKEKESIDIKIENFENALKDLDRLLGSQKLVKDIKGIGFNEYFVAIPPPVQVYSPPKNDLSWMGLPEFVDDTVTYYIRPTPSINVSKSVSKEQEERWKSNNPSFFEQGGSSGNVVSKPMIMFVKESSCPNAT